MITKLSSQQKDFNIQLSSLISWESVSNKDVVNTVEEIINTIRSKGDKALIDYSIKFDGDKTKVLTSKSLSKLFDRPIKIIEENGFYQALPG